MRDIVSYIIKVLFFLNSIKTDRARVDFFKLAMSTICCAEAQNAFCKTLPLPLAKQKYKWQQIELYNIFETLWNSVYYYCYHFSAPQKGHR